ncbi:glutamate--cysteine ligase [Dermatobacter hominis]|uniref:glutamate--cysteine ligase n=1 Tax=Dermatobacter hominis TaxID=2884263 RepID=UPI001D113D82|nr:glutamate--cysteine ligase [Dermatobacter hominis]UDY36904.1 glutamate--cysteine ligase [Dermatobacter hominis]
MAIEFRTSPTTTLGVELELGLVDRGSRELVNAASEVLARLAGGGPGTGAAARGEGDEPPEHPKVKHELFESTLEVITGINDTVDAAVADLTGTLGEVGGALAAGDSDLGLIASGTHPFSRWADLKVSPADRYRELIERIGWPARRLAIHGTHVHVGVRSGEMAVAVTNGLAVQLPLFLALSASSPYWEGHDTGLCSARTKIFESLPTAGLPPGLDGWDDFQEFMGTLLTAGAINSIREVWWDVRPHPDFGTVELRMCDALQSMDEVRAIVALAQCSVADLQARAAAGEPTATVRDWVIRENKWLAARHGIDAEIITDDRGSRRPARELVAEEVDRLAPIADELGCAGDLALVGRILRHGSGAERQRAVLAGGGDHRDVVDLLLAEWDAGMPA